MNDFKHDKEDHLREANESLRLAIEWMKANWHWPKNEDEKIIIENPDQLIRLVHEYFGEDRWESEFRRFRDENPDLKLTHD